MEKYSSADVQSSCLPSGILEYISSWDNENIANRILAKRNVTNKTFPKDPLNEVKLASKTESFKGAKKDVKDIKYKNDVIVNVEQPSFKLFGFEFAPIFIPIERRLQVSY